MSLRRKFEGHVDCNRVFHRFPIKLERFVLPVFHRIHSRLSKERGSIHDFYISHRPIFHDRCGQNYRALQSQLTGLWRINRRNSTQQLATRNAS